MLCHFKGAVWPVGSCADPFHFIIWEAGSCPCQLVLKWGSYCSPEIDQGKVDPSHICYELIMYMQGIVTIYLRSNINSLNLINCISSISLLCHGARLKAISNLLKLRTHSLNRPTVNRLSVKDKRLLLDPPNSHQWDSLLMSLIWGQMFSLYIPPKTQLVSCR